MEVILMKVGFIGLGIMGKPMALHVIKSGYETYIFDLNTNAVDELKILGGNACSSNSEIAENCDVIITMLPTSKHVTQVLFSEEGLANNCKPGTIVIDMSSVSTEDSREFAAKLKPFNIQFMDAPVSGGEPMALEGRLSIMVGGEEQDFEKVLPLFQTMGENIVHFGESGTGSAAKLANQIIVSINLAGLSEACVYASKSGIDLNKLFEAISGGLAGSAVMDAKMPSIIERNFEPGGKIETNFKDLGNIQHSANALGVPLPVTNIVKEIFSSEVANGNSKKDHSYIIDFFEKMANHRV
ncbi:2-hydroxy-3-oxopropionate reductase [Staphylococcus shinii]|uniref:2-hydroxy-3-oxopropionate reductase n=1 Tax=Staphylococcus shinii TaxID=2912228 RepID=UPI0021750F45|nr:2-hydroxy-3-oxopropionate reductase [Staphylococcus shinii]MDW8563798.1 2-hydroxy-3-oxopropionate reductase [Staphylococcus shinii]